MTGIHFKIRGLVQGVGFRWFVARHATRLGVVGYARNLPDGCVEIVASGPPDAIRSLEQELARGPEFARVDGVEKGEISLEGTSIISFDIR